MPARNLHRYVIRAFSISAFLAAPTLAWAGNPIPLSDSQLDRVTAGAGAYVIGSSDAAALGVLAITQTGSNTMVVSGASPNPEQPGFATAGGAVVDTALAQGSNLGQQGAPPASSTTAVTTTANAAGNLVLTNSFNATVHGAGGVVFQVGWTAVVGSWIGF